MYDLLTCGATCEAHLEKLMCRVKVTQSEESRVESSLLKSKLKQELQRFLESSNIGSKQSYKKEAFLMEGGRHVESMFDTKFVGFGAKKEKQVAKQ